MKYAPKIEFEYRVKIWFIVAVVLVLCILTYVFFEVARVNDSGVILLRLITLDTQNATIFYYAFATLILVMALRSIQLLVRSFGVDRFVILGQFAVTAPIVPNGKLLKTINYADITNADLVTFNHQTHLFIKSTTGRIQIQRAAFKSKQKFQDFVNELDNRVHHASNSYVEKQ